MSRSSERSVNQVAAIGKPGRQGIQVRLSAGLTVETRTRTQERLEAEARDLAYPALGEDAWRREWERGHELRFEGAIAYALAEAPSREERAS